MNNASSEENAVYGPWQIEHRCVACQKMLALIDRFHRNGCCPHCGNLTSGTICATTKHAYRLKTTGRWWWKTVTRVYKDA